MLAGSDTLQLRPLDNRRILVVLAVVVASIVLIAQWPALSAGAICFDDAQYFKDNYFVRHPSWASAGRFLSEVRAPSTVMGYYQPLTMISLMLDCAMGGSPDNLAPVHRTSLVLHTANTILIILLVYQLLGNVWAAAMVGLLFGVHPMTVETIAWIGERKTVLATFFGLASIISYVHYVRTLVWDRHLAGPIDRLSSPLRLSSSPSLRVEDRPEGEAGPTWRRWAWYGTALGLFVLALMSKPTVTPIPLLLLILDAWPLNRLGRRAAIEKWPWILIAAVSAVITYASQTKTAGTCNLAAMSPLLIPYILCHNIVFYPSKILWPMHLSPHYPYPDPMTLAHPMVLAGVIGAFTLLVLLAVSLRWTRALLAGWAFFFVAILPTMGVVGFTIVIASDKYAYFPVVGLLLVLAALIGWIWRGTTGDAGVTSRRVGLGMIVLVACSLEIASTRSYLGKWHDSGTLARHMVEQSPNSGVVHNLLGAALMNAGELVPAEAEIRRACELEPRNAIALNNLGLILQVTGRYAEAITFFKRSMDADEHLADPPFNLANTLMQMNRPAEAVEFYERAIQLRPSDGRAYRYYASALKLQGKTTQALQAYRIALELNPHSAEAWKNVGDLLLMAGDGNSALDAYRAAVRANPRYTEARSNMAGLLARQGRIEEAIREFETIVATSPSYVTARKNLAELLMVRGRLAEAMAQYREVLNIRPDDAQARSRLMALASRPDSQPTPGATSRPR